MRRPLRKLSARHKQAARLLVSGYSQREVSKRIGMSEAHLSVVVGSPLFKEEVKKLESELNSSVTKAHAILVESASKAAKTKVDLLESDNERIRGDSASDILKGVGALHTEQTEQQNITLNISYEQWQLIFQTLKEIRDHEAQNDETNKSEQ